MRLPAVLLLASVAAHVDSAAVGASPIDERSVAERPVRLAGLGESVPQLFLNLVNDALKGRIDAKSIRYDAPSSVVLLDARLLDPRGDVVARVKRARATLSLSELLSGEIVVSHVELEDPQLDLVLKNEKLNLLEALTPKKPPDKTKKAKATFRIDEIRATRGSFQFTDGVNATVIAAGINAVASLEIDLARDIVIVDVKAPTITSGKVILKELDVPLTTIKAKRVIVYAERVDIYDASAKAAGANVTASGSIMVKAPGNLGIHGFVDAPAGAWPDRMKPLPFELPALKGKVDVTGPFADPLVVADATFGAATAYGYRADSGRGVVAIKKDVVTIKEGSVVRASGGAVHAEGTVALPGLALDLRLRAVDVPLAAALQPAKLEPAPKGSVSARAHLTGIADGTAPIRIDVNGSARRVEIVGVAPRGDVQMDAKVTVKPKLVVIDAGSLKGDGLDAKISGNVFTEEERIAFDVNARVENAPGWVAVVPEPIKLASATFVGKITGPYKNVVVEGNATGANGDAYGVPFDDVSTHLTASATRVTISRARAKAAGGRANTVSDIVVELKGNKSIRGVVAAKGVDLANIQAPDGTDLPIAGVADAEAVLAGPYENPTVTVRAAVGGFIVADESLGSLVARFKTTKTLLTVIDAVVDGPVVRATTDDLRLSIEDLGLEGSLDVERVDLAAIKAAKEADLKGTAVGHVTVRGNARAPTLHANLQVRDVAVGPQRFGDGPLDVSFAPDPFGVPATSTVARAVKGKAASPPAATKRSAEAEPVRHVVTLAAKLASDIGVWDATASFAIQRKVVNAKVRFSDVDLAPFTQQLGSAVSPLEGFAFGSVEAWGPLEKLSMRTRLRVPEVAVAPYRGGEVEPVAGAVPILRALGALVVEARMDEGELSARVCAFPTARPSGPPSVGAPNFGTTVAGLDDVAAPNVDDASPCKDGERIWANVVGSLDALNGVFDLSVDGVLEEKAIEDLVPTIAKRGFRVGGKVRASAQLAKAKGEPVAVTAEATLLAATLQPPDEELRASLQAPAEILYEDRRVRLESPAHFKTPSGEIDVTVGGAAGEEDIAIDIEGSIALALTKLFSEQIANARGTAQTELSIRGRYDEGVVVEGSITPTPGAVITPRALGQPVQFLDGTISFAPVPDSNLLRITADGVKAKVGDGEALLRGSVDARTVREADEGLIGRWDLALTGSGLSFRLPTGAVEGGADLVLVGTEASPVLRGRVEVNDGTFRKKFELRNFVLASAPGKPTEPLWQTLAPIGLADLQLDVAVTLQNFRVRANVASFDADMLLRGNLRVSKMLRLPVIDGAVEVEEGEITFPKARFEVIEMQVEFPSTGDGRLNPLVHLTARAEIPPGAAGNNDTEIPIDLYLDGDLEKGINLDLFATDPVRQWSRSELLGLILFGKSVEQTVADRDVSLAFNALLNEASAPLTAELEQLAQETFGVDVEIAATGWRWQLGRRLQVEGEVSLISNDTTTDPNSSVATSSTASATSSTSSSTSDTLRLRLLIIDHLQPFGRNLSLEARNSPIGSDLRLSLRIFEE